jgi:hypothetical protein
MSEYETAFQSIGELAEQVHALNQRAVREYTPIVHGILVSGSRDVQHIEHTLDGLLDFCAYEPALVLFKTLCRYYWTIDLVTTGSYVNAYREMWDAEGGQE